MESAKEGSLQNRKSKSSTFLSIIAIPLNAHIRQSIDVIKCCIFGIASLICYTQSFTNLWLYCIYRLVSILAGIYGTGSLNRQEILTLNWKNVIQ